VIGLVATQLVVLSRREFLPADPGYRVDALVPAPDGSDAAPIRLAVLGDSTVAGVGSPSMGSSLPVLVAERLAARLGRPVRVRGYGVTGARTASVLGEQLPRLAEDGDLDAIALVVGANDATHATGPNAFRQQVDAMLALAARSAPIVVLAGTPRFHRNPVIPEPIRTVLDRYSAVLRDAQRAAVRAWPGARFVDLAAEASPRFLGVPAATSADGFHPSPIGYGFWADAIAPELAAGLGGG
jgi:lysophospholipase L1-like esterase